MKLLVIRHGIAAERAEAESDEERPLTERGRRRMKQAARGLGRLVEHVDRLATSPLLRARQTAELVGRELGIEPEVVDELAPSVPLRRLLEWLAACDHGAVAIVGHEDGLSTFVSWLISGRPESHLVLKKGGACLVELAGRVVPGTAELVWLMTPRQLRVMR